MTSISLVIPTYNRADLISETLDAALIQTKRFSEIIVIDDGSTDDTIRVLEKYADRISVVSTLNGGVQAARNRGVQVASSDYVTFCDSDDLLEPDFVETISTFLAAHSNVDAAYTNLKKFNSNSVDPDDFSQAPGHFMHGAEVEGEFFFDIPDLYLRLFTVHCFYIAGCTVKKTFFNAIGGFDPQFKGVGAEDGEFTLRAVASGRVGYCRMPLARVRRHDGNDSADALHMTLGSAHILDYAAVHHPNVINYASALCVEADRLRLGTFDAAFAQGNFSMVAKVLKQKFRGPLGLKFRLKKTISCLPEPLRSLAWQASQKVLLPKQ